MGNNFVFILFYTVIFYINIKYKVYYNVPTYKLSKFIHLHNHQTKTFLWEATDISADRVISFYNIVKAL